ncbi:MAG TPA: hypothetical protein VGP88_05700 [Thermoplasmata archaeon]|jgi:hypothetical protein|nr:hypothetical protein [Thermoplasmata archaeon]
MTNVLDVLGIALIASAIAMVTVGIANAALWARKGGLVRGLAHVVADPARAQRFLVYLSMVIGSFVVFTVIEGVQIATTFDNDLLSAASAGVLLAGALALVVLTIDGLPSAELSLSEELLLEEEEPGVLQAVDSLQPEIVTPARSSMYVVPRPHLER